MTRFNQRLIALFAVQLLLTAGIYIGSQPPSIENVQTALLGSDKSQISHITIEDGDGKQVQLSNSDNSWRLPNYHQLPADQSKVEQALATLANTKSGWPVATTSSSQERLKVSEDKYQIRITLADDDNEQQLYLGTSPGFRQVHLRKAGEDEIYTVTLTSHDFPADSSHWLDRTLARPGGEITGLKGPGFVINKQAGEWQLPDGKGAPMKEELNKLVDGLSSLNVLEAKEKTAAKPNYSLSVKTAKENINYRFFNEEENYYISHDGYDQLFKISKLNYEKITGQTAEKLVKAQNLESGRLTAGSTDNST